MWMNNKLLENRLKMRVGASQKPVFGAVVAVLSVLAPENALAGPYRLQPGDLVRIEIDGAQRPAMIVTIDTDGILDHSRIGAITAAGLTIAELRGRISDQIADTALTIITPEGERRTFVVDKGDVRVDIETVRPIVVAGIVRSPGKIDWSPGLTARRAIALAGGFALPPGAPTDLASLRAALDRLRLEQAATSLALWRVNATNKVKQGTAPTAPDEAVALIDQTSAARMIGIARERLRVAVEARRLARAHLNERIALIDRQRDLLGSLIVKYEGSVVDDERELEAVQALFDRGVTPRDRLSEVRRATALSSTRLLEARANEADLVLEGANVRQALEALALREAEEDAAVREETMIQLLRLGAQLASAQSALSVATAGGGALSDSMLTVRIEGINGKIAPASLDAELSPGDLVDVILGTGD